MELAIRVESVSVNLGGKQILKDVSFEVARGEMVALVGPNGAGKSTLLGVLSGDIAPDSGQIWWQGSRMAERSLKELARQRAVLLQDNPVSFGFSVSEVIEMGRAPWWDYPQMDSAYDRKIIEAAHRDADVNHLKSRSYLTLSGGEKARTSYGRILAQEAQVLLLDEPTAALDVRHQERVLGQASLRASQGATVILVLHDLSLAASWCDHIVVMQQGSIVADGVPQTTLTSSKLSDIYNHPIEVFPHPHTGQLLIVPVRGNSRSEIGVSEETQFQTKIEAENEDVAKP